MNRFKIFLRKYSIPAFSLFMVTALSGCKNHVDKPSIQYIQNKEDDSKEEDSEWDLEIDNSYCHVCHINFKKERLAKIHEKADVMCVECHGDSEKHSADENNLTAPDKMYPRDTIVKLCTGCHSRTTLEDVEDHEPLLSGKAEKGKDVCTDCHGSHKMAVRTKKWDKRTGKLVWSDGLMDMDK